MYVRPHLPLQIKQNGDQFAALHHDRLTTTCIALQQMHKLSCRKLVVCRQCRMNVMCCSHCTKHSMLARHEHVIKHNPMCIWMQGSPHQYTRLKCAAMNTPAPHSGCGQDLRSLCTLPESSTYSTQAPQDISSLNISSMLSPCCIALTCSNISI